MLLSLIAKQVLALLLPKHICRIEVGDVLGMEDESCIKGVILEALSTSWYGPKTNQTKVQLTLQMCRWWVQSVRENLELHFSCHLVLSHTVSNAYQALPHSLNLHLAWPLAEHLALPPGKTTLPPSHLAFLLPIEFHCHSVWEDSGSSRYWTSVMDHNFTSQRQRQHTWLPMTLPKKKWCCFFLAGFWSMHGNHAYYYSIFFWWRYKGLDWSWQASFFGFRTLLAA